MNPKHLIGRGGVNELHLLFVLLSIQLLFSPPEPCDVQEAIHSSVIVIINAIISLNMAHISSTESSTDHVSLCSRYLTDLRAVVYTTPLPAPILHLTTTPSLDTCSTHAHTHTRTQTHASPVQMLSESNGQGP